MDFMSSFNFHDFLYGMKMEGVVLIGNHQISLFRKTGKNGGSLVS